MRKVIAISALILGLSTVCLGLQHQGNVLRDMYARDTALAYSAGVRHGIEQAVDSSPDVEALTVLFARYRHADAPSYAKWVVYYSAEYRVPQIVLAGMVMQESSGRPDARSNCGAVGLTQIRWCCWGKVLTEAGIATCEADLLDPETSIEAGAFIVRTLLDQYEGDLEKVLKHYSGNARGYVEKCIGRVVG